MPRRRGDSLVKRAREHVAGGEGYDAREVLFKLMDKYPERVDREVRLLMAMSVEVDGSIYKAEDWTRSILKDEPDYLEAWKFLAVLLAKNEDRLDELEEVVNHGIKLGADRVAMLRRLAYGYSRNERYQDALKVHQEIVDMTPDDPFSWDSLAMTQHDLGQDEDSLRSWERKLELEPDDHRALYWTKQLRRKLSRENNSGKENSDG